MVGGEDYQGTAILNGVQLYDPTTNTWQLKNHTLTLRANHTATLLPSGKVLVAGGSTNTNYNSGLDSAEIYDPDANTWNPAAPMSVLRQNHFAILLTTGKNAGKVLVGSGTRSDLWAPLTSTEIYDPATNKWTPAAPMHNAHLRATPILMPDGKVFVAGGVGVVDSYQSAEMYDPVNDKWTELADIPEEREYNIAVLLKTCQVMLAGGYAPLDYNDFRLNAELYTPATNTWSEVALLNQTHYEAAAVVLQSGQVLLTGGYDADVNYVNLTYTKSVEIFQFNRRIYLPMVQK